MTLESFIAAIWPQVVGSLIAAAGAWAAIRIDIAVIMARHSAFEEATKQRFALLERDIARAHERIDSIKGER
jgi:hypothetical protein